MKKILPVSFFLFFVLCYTTPVKAQQDINFSQFYELPLLRNPALAGIFNGNVRFTAAYRNQWESVSVPYRTMALGSEIKFFKGLLTGDFITAGFQITNDVAGDSKLKRTQFLPVLNYHKSLNEDQGTFISLAFMGGPVQENFDPASLKFDDQFVNGSYSSSNPTSQTFNRTSFGYLDVSTGLSFTSYLNNYTRFYIGTGLYHFTRPKLSFMADNEVVLNKKWIINAGLSTYTNTFSKLVFYADYFMQGANRMAQGGLLFTRNLDPKGDEANLSISAGIAYRFKDAIIPVVKLNTNKLGIGMSYDVNVSSLKKASHYKGGFELSLTYMDLWNSGNPNLEKLHCPITVF
jgi:type IX secretion system PorP/SprF family membrane protein